MNSRTQSPLRTLLALLFLALPLLAETVQLREGGVLVGDVTLRDDGAVVVEARYPEEREFILKPEELTPLSLYQLHERRADPADPTQRLALGQRAEEAGLFGIAIAEYRAALALDPSLEREVSRRLSSVGEGIAERLLASARSKLDAGQPRAAVLDLHTILERYPESKAAQRARRMMSSAHTRAGASLEVAKKTVAESKAPKLIGEIRKILARADEAETKAGGHVGESTRDQRVLEQVIRYLERAWEDVRRLPVASKDTELQAVIDGLRKAGRERLVEAYLKIGTLHLQRRSIPEAERYCGLACELDPENERNHHLHELILQAKIYDSGGWIR